MTGMIALSCARHDGIRRFRAVCRFKNRLFCRARAPPDCQALQPGIYLRRSMHALLARLHLEAMCALDDVLMHVVDVVQG